MKHLIVMALSLSFATVTSANDVIREHLEEQKQTLEQEIDNSLRLMNMRFGGSYVAGEEQKTFDNFVASTQQKIEEDELLHEKIALEAEMKLQQMTKDDDTRARDTLCSNAQGEAIVYCEQVRQALYSIKRRIAYNKQVLADYDDPKKVADVQNSIAKKIAGFDSELRTINRQLADYAPASGLSDKEMSSHFDPEVVVGRVLNRYTATSQVPNSPAGTSDYPVEDEDFVPNQEVK